MKSIVFSLLCIISNFANAQYIGVQARYTESRLVDNPGNPQSRENRLILSFFDVSPAGLWTPTVLSNYPIWVYKEGLQYGSMIGGVVDSAGNNYPGYSYTAPRTVAYFNSYFPHWIDCDPNLATGYTVNGHELDCGFIRVSSWEEGNEYFTAPNVCLPYYIWPDPYATLPGNVNFSWPVPATPPYNFYSLFCAGSTQQLVIRGVLTHDTSGIFVPLPVRFANVKGNIDAADKVSISWSNMTESDILHYNIERSGDGVSFVTIGNVLPTGNSGSRADYIFLSTQSDPKAFYRIKAIENNGAFIYSIIFLLNRNVSSLDDDQSLSVYPNPTTGNEFTFRLTNAAEGRYISCIITPRGQQIRHKLINHNGGDLARQVDMTGLPTGIYQLLLRSSTKKYTQKILYVH